MSIGILCALVAGLMWGLVFVTPLLLPDYPAALLSCGRYLAFGLIALPIAWFDRARLRELERSDWIEALRLSAIGNLLYYLCLAAAIQRAGGALPTMIIGTLPVVIAVCSNLRDPHERLPWRELLPPLGLIAAGIACVNQVELERLRAEGGLDAGRYLVGALLALAAVACWTWYPIRNADWMRAHPDRHPRSWATAQGLMTLPLAVLGYGVLGLVSLTPAGAAGLGVAMPFGPEPLRFVLMMLAVGLLASWVGTLCWNAASQRLPTALLGQLIVFETLAALGYAMVMRGRWPGTTTLAGIVLLVAGVLLALRVKPRRGGAAGADAQPVTPA
ncbi:MAG: DMT family transporter [Sphaerotilus sulfidivorans]|uniref:DMT family transporter n=1 Tax=Sphaerotilus sulfidivorans TaxID=639200 RepID=UPI003F2C87FA